MTCIVAIRDPLTKTVVVAGDSRRSMGHVLRTTLPRNKGKVYQMAGFVFGHTGNGRIRHLTSGLKLKFGKDGPDKKFNLETALLETIVPKLKELAKKYGFLETEKDMPKLGGVILIAFGKEVCLIEDDFSVTPITGEYWAVGSGVYFALGSLYTTEKSKLSPIQRALKALAAANNFTDTVGPPYIWKQTTALRKMRKKK